VAQKLNLTWGRSLGPIGASYNREAGVHGVLFTSLRDYLTSAHGHTVALDVFTGQPIFLLSESYEDELLARLVERASEATSRDVEEVFHDFGIFTARTTFTRLYPAFFAIAPSTREFLLTVETRIHELVRATIPNAAPPQLQIDEYGDEGVRITYSSTRRLCVLLRGLVQGTAQHYGEVATIDEPTCMHRGDSACTFEIRLSGPDFA
jgi:predicted hydrocarbon binding protein